MSPLLPPSHTSLEKRDSESMLKKVDEIDYFLNYKIKDYGAGGYIIYIGNRSNHGKGSVPLTTECLDAIKKRLIVERKKLVKDLKDKGIKIKDNWLRSSK